MVAFNIRAATDSDAEITMVTIFISLYVAHT